MISFEETRRGTYPTDGSTLSVRLFPDKRKICRRMSEKKAASGRPIALQCEVENMCLP